MIDRRWWARCRPWPFLIFALVLGCKPSVPWHGVAVYTWEGDDVTRVSPERGWYRNQNINAQGTEIVYCGGVEWPPRIWRTELASGDSMPLSPADCVAVLPTFSHDGERVLFCSDIGNPSDFSPEPGVPWQQAIAAWSEYSSPVHLFLMDRDGGNVRQVTAGDLRITRACFSPDDRSIAFISKGDMWLQSLEPGAAPRMVSEAARRPWYSPDGSRIYFHRQLDSTGSQLYWIPANGGEEHMLPNAPGGVSRGVFVEGESLLVHSDFDTDPRTWRIWEVPLDGSPPRMLAPPGIVWATHTSRSGNGIISFDGRHE